MQQLALQDDLIRSMHRRVAGRSHLVAGPPVHGTDGDVYAANPLYEASLVSPTPAFSKRPVSSRLGFDHNCRNNGSTAFWRRRNFPARDQLQRFQQRLCTANGDNISAQSGLANGNGQIEVASRPFTACSMWLLGVSAGSAASAPLIRRPIQTSTFNRNCANLGFFSITL
jgi:hypothetical protein